MAGCVLVASFRMDTAMSSQAGPLVVCFPATAQAQAVVLLSAPAQSAWRPVLDREMNAAGYHKQTLGPSGDVACLRQGKAGGDFGRLS